MQECMPTKSQVMQAKARKADIISPIGAMKIMPESALAPMAA